LSEQKICFIGIGNRFRSDDAAGIKIMEALSEDALPGASYLEASGEGATLIEMIEKEEVVYLFDAVSSGQKPGTIFRFDAAAEKVPAKFFNYSTHAFSVAEAVEMARALNKLPPKLILFGVEGKNFEQAKQISNEVAGAIKKVVENVKKETTILNDASDKSTVGI